MANWLTNCNTGTGSLTAASPRTARSCALCRQRGSGGLGTRRDGSPLARDPVVAAGRECAQRVEEPRQRVAGVLLADEVSDQGGEHRARLVRHLAVARPEGRPERAEDEAHHPEEAHQAELAEDLELEV